MTRQGDDEASGLEAQTVVSEEWELKGIQDPYVISKALAPVQEH